MIHEVVRRTRPEAAGLLAALNLLALSTTDPARLELLRLRICLLVANGERSDRRVPAAQAAA